MVARAVLPTYVTDKLVVLGKNCSIIRNTYEIRLALFMAKSKNLRFILAVPPKAEVENSLLTLLSENEAHIEEVNLQEFSVYFGCINSSGEEGWVLGNGSDFTELTSSIKSNELRNSLYIGATFKSSQLMQLKLEIENEVISKANIDGENAKVALLGLICLANETNGTIFIQ